MKRSKFFRAIVSSVFVVPSWVAAAAPAGPPTLVVAIVVDQYSADLFGEYRSLYRHGLATLAGGAVFPRGYQSHSGTETCPGHATVLTGARPAHTGIIANEWQNPTGYMENGEKKFSWYCVKTLSDKGEMVISPETLLVPTLGDRLRAADPKSRSVAIGGKDRAAVVLGGKHASLTLWWERGKGFVTYKNAVVDAPMRAKIDAVNEDVKAAYQSPQLARSPAECSERSKPVEIVGKYSVGELHDTKAASDKWRATPALDSLTLEMAKAALDTLELGKGPSVDVLALSFSATDYVGHYYGTEGAEMCAQQFALDKTIEELLTHLNRKQISYVVALTADHGGLDIPERNQSRGVPQASRIDARLFPGKIGAAVAEKLKLQEPVLLGGSLFTNDVWLSPSVKPGARQKVLDAVRKEYEAYEQSGQVAAVFTRSELVAAKAPSGPPDQWSLRDRAKASFNEKRSGDLVVFLKPYVTSYDKPTNVDEQYISSHGSPWDYDRRVPIVFWWPGIEGFEQPAAVETVDIAPTLADVVGLKVEANEMDGRVLQIGQTPK